MKTKLLIILFLCSFLGFSQSEKNYVLLDSLASKYQVNKYTLNTNKLYGVHTEVEMYNILRGEIILLISVLPNLYNNQPKWKEIQWQEIKNNVISPEKITRRIINIISPYEASDYMLESKEFNKFSLVKKENEKYYVAKFSLFEWFYVVEFKSYINVSQIKNYILNLGQNPIKRIDFMEGKDKESFFIPHHLRNIYLSQIENHGNEKIYRFWTFDGWQVSDYYNEHRGIDRFAYIEGKGIVGGSYDFYFKFVPKYTSKNHIYIKLTPEQWEENGLQEKIMWAKELFPERQ
ncbi:hypothetical protein ACF3OE_04595 [Capnocytophaga canis]|uniref:hypothetical protein n=1 Tax=Capnocytophaga canis TaxID=1848903 RepID=UPI00370DDA7D